MVFTAPAVACSPNRRHSLLPESSNNRFCLFKPSFLAKDTYFVHDFVPEII
jgi:hypothetical protein